MSVCVFACDIRLMQCVCVSECVCLNVCVCVCVCDMSSMQCLSL